MRPADRCLRLQCDRWWSGVKRTRLIQLGERIRRRTWALRRIVRSHARDEVAERGRLVVARDLAEQHAERVEVALHSAGLAARDLRSDVTKRPQNLPRLRQAGCVLTAR